LDQAELEFKDRAFSPFWDAVERATISLGRFDQAIQTISNCSGRYRQILESFEGEAPPFTVGVTSIRGVSAAKPTTERLKSVVRVAQRDFQFATIYEQRKTNQILIQGFQTVAEAIYGMADRISSSID
jgi:hypothetical protein